MKWVFNEERSKAHEVIADLAKENPRRILCVGDVQSATGILALDDLRAMNMVGIYEVTPCPSPLRNISIQPDEREAARGAVIAAARNWRRSLGDIPAVCAGHAFDLIVALAFLDDLEAKEPTS